MLPHDRDGNRGPRSSSTSTTTPSNTDGNDSTGGAGRGAMATATTTRRKSKRLLFVFAAGFLGAAIVVFLTGGDQVRDILGRPTPTESQPAAPSTTATTGLQTSPPGDDDDDDGGGGGGDHHEQGSAGTAAAPAAAPAAAAAASPVGEIQNGETQTAAKGDGDGTEETPPPPPPPKPGLDLRNRASGGRSGSERVAVYVYDGVPELDHSDLVECYREKNGGVAPWQDEQADMAQDMGEIWLHRSVLVHPWRVFDPEEADVFFVPIYPILSIKLALAGERPWASGKAVDMDEHRCKGVTHNDRMTIAVDYLVRSSPFFNRFGGADHVVVCAWWNCRMALNPTHRMLLRRTVVGINEKNYWWTWWGCGNNRTLTVPYTASSVLTTSDKIGGAPANERDIPFFFVGTARGRPERTNLDVVMNISETSLIALGGDEASWGMNSTTYAAHMSRSRFCFCPRGDTPSSRRIFDALAAGCIPIVTEGGVNVLPFVGVGLNYSEFAVVVDESGFSTRENVENVVRDALARSDEETDELRRGVRKGVSSIVYGITRGPELEDMRPFMGTATNFLQAAYVLTGVSDEERGAEERKGTLWSCPDTRLSDARLAPRTLSSLPPPAQMSRQWLAETETIINRDRSLLFCAPPNTGSLQFRMLAKRMQGISHWSVHDDRSLLFDREASGLELLDVTNRGLLKVIYRANGSGWIKIGVVRDPVTRLLSAYLSLVKTWRAGLRLSGEAGDDADDAQESSPHDRKLQQHQPHEGSNAERRRLERARAKEASVGTKGDWDFFDAIVDERWRRRREGRRRRRSQLQQQQREGEEEAETVEGGGFHQDRGGAGGGSAGAGGTRGGGGGRGTAAGARRDNRVRPDHRQQVQHQHGRREQWRRETMLEDQTKSEIEAGDGVDNGEAWFWEGPGGWNGPIGAAAAAAEEQTAGVGDSGDHAEGGGGGGGDGTVEVGIPTFSEVLDALKTGIWNAPVAFRPAVSMCGQRNSPFDSIIPFERLQETSTEVLKSLPGGVWESFGASGWGPDGEHAFMEFDYGEAASAWRTSSIGDSGSGSGRSVEAEGQEGGARGLAGEAESEAEREAAVAGERLVDDANVGASGAQRGRGLDEERELDVNDDLATPLPRRARDLFDGEDPCAWVEFYGSLETLEEVGRLYEMDYKYYRWYRLDPWRERLKACLQE